MKELNEYLSTKINLSNEFPEEPNLKRTVSFLKNQDFKELEFDENKFYLTILEENEDSKRFMSNSYHRDGSDWDWIRFIGKGKLCKENPSFSMYFENDELTYMYEEFSLPAGNGNKYIDYKDFVKVVKSFFHWT